MLWYRSKKNEEAEKLKVLLHLATEISTEIRSRREPEYIYTASAIGAIGAIVLGVSALDRCLIINFDPAVIAIVLCIIIGIGIPFKIWRENEIYTCLREEQIRLYYKYIIDNVELSPLDLPLGLQKECSKSTTRAVRGPKNKSQCYDNNGKGFHYSFWIVLLLSLFAVWYCYSISLQPCPTKC